MTKNKKFIAVAVSLSLAASMLFTMPELIQSFSKQKGICLYPIMIMENWYVP